MARRHEAMARLNGSRGASGFAGGFWLELIATASGVAVLKTQSLSRKLPPNGEADKPRRLCSNAHGAPCHER